MPIPYGSAEQLVRKMSKMLKYPGEWDALETAMIRALAEAARDEAHADSLVTRLMARQLYAPAPCEITELAVTDSDRSRHDAPSPYDQPGEHGGSLTDGMTLEDVQRWQALAARTKHKATRDVALGMIADFYKRHPELAPPQAG